MKITWCGRTHICGRRTNEDAFAMQQVTPRLAAFAIADGVGGLPAGEISSRIAVDSLMEIVRLTIPEDTTCTPGMMKAMLDAGFLAASGAIDKAIASNPGLEGMATTLVGALINDECDVVVAFVGDSRAYRAGEGIIPITTDHSLVQEMVSRGIITEEGARVHPDKNVVTRVVNATPVHPDFTSLKLEDEALLLCTDGLSDALNEEEILSAMKYPDLDRVCSDLIERAVHVNRDNTTVIIIRALTEP